MTQGLLFLCKTRTAQNTLQEFCVETGEVGSPAHLSPSGTRAKAGRWPCLKGKRVPRVFHWNFKWVTDPLRCDGLGPVTWYHPPTHHQASGKSHSHGCQESREPEAESNYCSV